MPRGIYVRTEEQKENNRKAQLKHYQEHPERIDKIRQGHIGFKYSEESKLNMSKASLGKKKSPEHKEKVRLSHNTIEYIKNISGKLNGMYGKSPSHSHKKYIHSTPFQGERKMHRWEHLYASYLDSIGEEYFYEPNPFAMNINGRDTTYTLDFFLLNSSKFVEVKGYWRDDAKAKFEQFKEIIEQYYNYEVLMKEKLQNLGINLK